MDSNEIDRPDWDDVRRRATELLSEYIRIDTTNPPGNEAASARLLSAALAAEGIAVDLYEPDPDRANLVARLRAGSPRARPLLLLHHMDVVRAKPETWQVPPFGGDVRDGYIWGRGAIDDKGLGAMHLMAFLLLAKSAVPLSRDVILMAVADEEEGGTLGTRWMTENHWDDIECEYVWDEGGAGSRGVVGDAAVFSISVWEKRSMVLRLTVSGPGGHGATATHTPVDNLAAALHRLQRHHARVRFNPVTREFFRRISATQPAPISWLMRSAASPALRPLMSVRARRTPIINAMLRDTIATTMLEAGDKANVSPETATAMLNARILPDTDPDLFVEEVRKVLGGDVDVEVVALTEASPASPLDSGLFNAIERAIAAEVPGAVVAPMQTPFVTDSRYFRLKGAKAYGLIPAVLTPDELNTIHGVDERISIDNLVLGIKITYETLVRLCSTAPSE